MSLIVGIDASRNRSGGAQAHLIGILSSVDPGKHGINKIHVWSFKSLLDSIPDRPWLRKHNPPALEKSLAKQLWWQAFDLAKDVKRLSCDILFTSDASSVCLYRPMVVLSQDLLSYEPKVMQRFGFGFKRLRLQAILYVQNAAFRRANGVIFLTRYAGSLIQKSCGLLKRTVYISHGVDERFKNIRSDRAWPKDRERPIRCLYVSPVSEFKHQGEVVEAVASLRESGYDLDLTLIGGGSGRAQALLDAQIARADPQNVSIRQLGSIPYGKMPGHLSVTDLFVFASSCETFGITLLEGMSAGLPIACSNRSSLPETLENGGIYFDPEDASSIANAIEQIITDGDLRTRIAQRAKVLASQYSWQRCADETWKFIRETYDEVLEDGNVKSY